MKSGKKILALIIALVMVIAVAVPAMGVIGEAAENGYGFVTTTPSAVGIDAFNTGTNIIVNVATHGQMLRVMSGTAAQINTEYGDEAGFITAVTGTNSADVDITTTALFVAARNAGEVVTVNLTTSFDQTGNINIDSGRNIVLRSDAPQTLTHTLTTRHFTIRNNNGNGTLTLADNVTLTRVDPTAETNGGGIAVSDGGTFIMSGGTISGIRATNGGGIAVDGGTFTMSGGTINNNHATNNGGGVRAVNGGTFTMSGGTISNNTTSGSGGGVHVHTDSLFTMTDGEITNNNAANGGGVAIGAGEFQFRGGIISGNTSTGHGGGVRNAGQGVFIMFGNAIIENNRAGSSGGGVRLDGSATIAGGQITNNTAGFDGGGIDVASGAVLTITGGEIKENTARYGNAIRITTDSDFNLENGIIDADILRSTGGGGWVWFPSDMWNEINIGTDNDNGNIVVTDSDGQIIVIRAPGNSNIILPGSDGEGSVDVNLPFPSGREVTVPEGSEVFFDNEGVVIIRLPDGSLENIDGVPVIRDPGRPDDNVHIPRQDDGSYRDDDDNIWIPNPNNPATPPHINVEREDDGSYRDVNDDGNVFIPNPNYPGAGERPFIPVEPEDDGSYRDGDDNAFIPNPNYPGAGERPFIPVEPEDDGSFRDGDDNAFIPNPNYPGAGERPFIPVEPEDDGSYRDGDDNAFIPNPNYPGAGERPFIPVEPEDDGSFRDGDDNAFIPNPNYPGAGERPFIPVEPEDDGTFRDEDGNVWRPNPNFPGAGERPFIPVTPDTGGGNQGGTGGNNQGGGTGGAGGGGAGGGTTTPPTTPPTQPPETQPPTTQPSTTTTTPPINNPFTDVNGNDWFYNAVMFNYRNGLMVGTSSTLFSPNAPLTRAMIVTLLHRQAGLPNASSTNQFTDVANNTWYTAAINWAAENDIVLGFGDDTFRPHLHITRQHLALIMARYADFRGIQIPAIRQQANFADSNQIHDYATAAVLRLSAAGIINGRPGNVFDPLGTATRAEVATMMYNFLNAIN